MKYIVSLSETHMSQEEVNEYLQHHLVTYIGGLSQFYGRRVLFDFTYTKQTSLNPHVGNVNIHTLSTDIQEINVTKHVEIKPVSYMEPRKSRWERFKQFVKGE